MKTVITALLLGFIVSNGLQAQTMVQDTLIYDTSYGDTLYLKPYEVAVCIFKIPADGVIKGFNVPIAAIDFSADTNAIELEIWRLNYPFDSTGNSYDSYYVDENGWLGYYPSIDNDTIPIYDNYWSDRDWNAIGDTGLCTSAELVPNTQDPLNTRRWWGDFVPYAITTMGDHWVDLEAVGYLSVQKDEYVGIFLYHHLPLGTYEDTTPVVGFHSNNTTEINNPYPLLVFSPSCRGISGEGGWHIRSAVLNCELAIEYESVSTEEEPEFPASFALRPNYPNPFNPVTTINYQIPKTVQVNLSVYNLAGQLVQTLVNEPKSAGFHSVEWNAKEISSGVYYYRIVAGEYVAVKKCIVIK